MTIKKLYGLQVIGGVEESEARKYLPNKKQGRIHGNPVADG